jgi:hypothetical protein
MAGNVFEWVHDWYEHRYYSHTAGFHRGERGDRREEEKRVHHGSHGDHGYDGWEKIGLGLKPRSPPIGVLRATTRRKVVFLRRFPRLAARRKHLTTDYTDGTDWRRRKRRG